MEKFLAFMKQDLNDLKSITLDELNATKENTAVIFVDMVKGFYNKGPLANENVANIIKPLVDLNEKTKDYRKIFFIDSHEENSVEFNSYPRHCVRGTEEEELIDELLLSEGFKNPNTKIIKKNSINGFHCEEFKRFINEEEITNFIIVGVCTDICVKNLTISLITYFNEKNMRRKIIVPQNMVETYDASFHNREFWNLTALFEMKANGVCVVKDIN